MARGDKEEMLAWNVIRINRCFSTDNHAQLFPVFPVLSAALWISWCVFSLKPQLVESRNCMTIQTFKVCFLLPSSKTKLENIKLSCYKGLRQKNNRKTRQTLFLKYDYETCCLNLIKQMMYCFLMFGSWQYNILNLLKESMPDHSILVTATVPKPKYCSQLQLVRIFL